MNTNQAWQDVLTNPAAGSHIVQVCHNKALQVEVVTRYVKEGLLNDEAVIIIATSALRKAVIAKMDVLGLEMCTLLKVKAKSSSLMLNFCYRVS